jgi:hypothetical protein
MPDTTVSVTGADIPQGVLAAQAARREAATRDMVGNAVAAALTAAQQANPRLDQKPGYGPRTKPTA